MPGFPESSNSQNNVYYQQPQQTGDATQNYGYVQTPQRPQNFVQTTQQPQQPIHLPQAVQYYTTQPQQSQSSVQQDGMTVYPQPQYSTPTNQNLYTASNQQMKSQPESTHYNYQTPAVQYYTEQSQQSQNATQQGSTAIYTQPQYPSIKNNQAVQNQQISSTPTSDIQQETDPDNNINYQQQTISSQNVQNFVVNQSVKSSNQSQPQAQSQPEIETETENTDDVSTKNIIGLSEPSIAESPKQTKPFTDHKLETLMKMNGDIKTFFIDDEPLTHIGNGYYYNSQGTYFTDSKGNILKFADSHIDDIYLEIEVFADESETRFYCVKVVNDQKLSKTIKVKTENWNRLVPEIKRQFPEGQIFNDQFGKADSMYQRAAGERLKQYLKDNVDEPPAVKFKYWGWSRKLENGLRRFLHNGLPDCDCDKALVPTEKDTEKHTAYLKMGKKMFLVASKEITYPLVMYCLAAFLDALFGDAGYPLKTCLMIIGKSGTKKTSTVKEIFNVFTPEKDRIHTVRSTEAALNDQIQKSYDDVLVGDDYNLEGSYKEVKDKDRGIRATIRTYSDKTPRETKYGKIAVRGGFVFTAETEMTGSLNSGELRYFKVFFDDSVNGSELMRFQSNPFIWQYFLSEFLRFVEAHYGEIVETFRVEFPKRRMNANISSPRLVDTFVHMTLTAEVLVWFLITNELIDKKQREEIIKDFEITMRKLLDKQNAGAKTLEAHIMFVSEFFHLLGSGKIKIAANLDSYLLNPRYYIGWRENGLIMVKRDEGYETVYNSFIARKDYLSCSINEVSRGLYEAGLSVADKGEYLKKAPSRIQGRPRMLCLVENKCLESIDAINK